MKHSSATHDDYQPLPMDAETLANSSYIARQPCGCVTGVMSLPKYVKCGGKFDSEDRKFFIEWLKQGCTIDRVPDQWIRDNGFERCEAHKSPPEQRRMEF